MAHVKKWCNRTRVLKKKLGFSSRFALSFLYEVKKLNVHFRTQFRKLLHQKEQLVKSHLKQDY